MPSSYNDKRRFRYSLDIFFSTFITAYFVVSLATLLINIKSEITFTSLAFLQENASALVLILSIISIVVSAAALTVLNFFLPRAKIIPHTMLISAFLLSFILIIKARDTVQFSFYLAIVAMLALVILYSAKQDCFAFIKKDAKPWLMWVIVGTFCAICASFIIAIGVLRYKTYSAPNYDFGIFCNMFYNMKKSGLPLVSCERDMLLSHFAVHFSPIYFLFLPVYFVFPYAETLQVLQALVLYSGIVPLVLIARKRGISRNITIIISLVYSSFAALGAGTFYDLHENCFLVPCLLWVFYFYEKRKYIPLAIFSLLTLLIKEDAFIYLVIFAIYILAAEKNWKVALPLSAVAIVYFITVSAVMNTYGQGIMTNRYGNLIFDADDGLLGALKTVILNPGYVLTQMFKTRDGSADKLKYLLQLTLPLGFLPFATKRISRFLLLTPLLLNLLTLYVYQPNITFQYSFGIIAFLFYAALLNISELHGFSRKYTLSLAVTASVLLFALICIPKFTMYVERQRDLAPTYEGMDYALEEKLPDDASVAASTFLIPHIYERDEIYEVSYHKENDEYKTDIEYVVLDMRYRDESLPIARFYLKNGYEISYYDEVNILILKKTN